MTLKPSIDGEIRICAKLAIKPDGINALRELNNGVVEDGSGQE
ncbi:hypothetical protein [Hoeflea sp. IMCC20628]|nr:hypothetical protein [Hoeflea sp. IMCC20628]